MFKKIKQLFTKQAPSIVTVCRPYVEDTRINVSREIYVVFTDDTQKRIANVSNYGICGSYLKIHTELSIPYNENDKKGSMNRDTTINIDKTNIRSFEVRTTYEKINTEE